MFPFLFSRLCQPRFVSPSRAGRFLLLLLVSTASLLGQTLRAPVFSRQPADQTAAEGYYSQLFAQASASPSPTYQWQRKMVGATDWVDLTESAPFAGVRSVYLWINPVAPTMSGDQFRLVATNSAGTAASNAATITVLPSSPGFNGAPYNQDVLPGATVEFSVTAIGTPPLSYQWLKNGTEIPNATLATLTLTNVQLADEALYSVRVSNALGSATSSSGRLQVVLLPAITWQPPAALTRFVGDSVGVSAGATSKVTSTYQWLRDGTPVPNANTSTLSIASVQPADQGSYRLRITNLAGSVLTDAMALTVLPQPVPTVDSSASGKNTIPVLWGGSASLTTSVSSRSAATYQWYRDGVALPGATQATLALANVGAVDFADYILAATNASGTALSATIRVVPASTSSRPAHHWIDAQEVDGVIYFTFTDTPRILRFDRASNSWLAPWSLPSTPVAIAFSSDAIYVADATNVTRYGRDFSSPTLQWSGTTSIRHIATYGDVLIVASFGSNAATTVVRTFQRQTGQAIAQGSYTYQFSANFSFDSSSGLLIGRDGSTQPNLLPINADGTLSSVRSSWPTDTLPSTGRTWILRAGELVGQASGLVLREADVGRVSSTGSGTDDAITRPGGYYVLQAGRVREFDSAFRETRSMALGLKGDRLWSDGGTLLVFGQPTTPGGIPDMVRVDPRDFVAPSAAAPIAPEALAVPSPQIEVDGEGMVFVLSRLHRNVLRWSAATASYQSSLGLAAQPNFFAVDGRAARLVFESSDHQLMQQASNGVGAEAAPLFRTTGALSAVTPADDLLAVGTRLDETAFFGNGTEHFLLDRTGQRAAEHGQFSAERSLGYAWSATEKRLYFMRWSNPTSLIFLQINSAGRFNTSIGGNYNLSVGGAAEAFLRPSDDGKWVVFRNGQIVRTADLTSVGYLPWTIVDAAWAEGCVHTIRPSLAGTTLETWSIPDQRLLASTTTPGVPLRLVRLKADRLLVVTAQADVPTYRTFAATTLMPIAAADRTAPPQIDRQSSDVAGEAGQSAVFWVETSGGVLPTYQWQMRASGSADWIDVQDDDRISGARTGRLFISQLQPAQAGARFRVIVSNPGGTVTSVANGLSVTGGAAVTQVAVGDSHLVFRRADGTAWAMGGESSYSIGDGFNVVRTAPVPIATQVAQVFANHYGSGYLKSDGSFFIVNPTGNRALFPPEDTTGVLLPRPLALEARRISWGWRHVLVLDKHGTLWGSGDATYGQLGVSSSYEIPLRDITWPVVSMTANGTYATWYLTADGRLCSLGSYMASSPVLPVVLDTDVVQLEGNADHIVYIKRDGSAWTYGGNTNGQLGDGTTSNRTAPFQVATDVKAVAAGTTHILLLKNDGSVWASGSNSNYQFGNGTRVSSPRFVRIAEGAQSIAAGGSLSAVVRSDGSLWVAGGLASNSYAAWTKLAEGLAPPPPAVAPAAEIDNYQGAVFVHWTPTIGAVDYELRRGLTANVADATLLADHVQATLFADTTAAIGTDYFYFVRARTPGGTTDFSAPVTGHATAGRAPTITLEPADSTFVATVTLTVGAEADPAPAYRWQQLAPSDSTWIDLVESFFSVGTTTNRLECKWIDPSLSGTRFRCVVTNPLGQAISRPATVTVRAAPPVFATQPNSAVLTPGATLNLIGWASGNNLSYQWKKDGVAIPGATSNALAVYGDAANAGNFTLVASNPGGAVESNPAIVTFAPAPGAIALGAGNDFSVILLADGSIRAMGANNQRQTGLAPNARLDPPAGGVGTTPFAFLSSSPRHSVFINRSGGVAAGGNNLYRQSFSDFGIDWADSYGAVAAAAGGYHSLILKNDGVVLACGLNSSGQLGDNTITDRSYPVQVLTDAIGIAAGGAHSLFLKSDGSLWACGSNDSGQLGLGDTTSRSVPVQVTTNVTTAAASDSFSVFVKSDGTLWGMGLNSDGQLGATVPLGTRAEFPIQIAEGVTRCAVGAAHLAFITSDGKLWTLGRNSQGQLGTGDLVARTTPFQLASDVTLVAAGAGHTLFADRTGSVWGVGSNAAGQLGLGNAESGPRQPVRLWVGTYSAPGANTLLNASYSTATGAIRLFWAPATDAHSYEVWRSTSPDPTSASLLVADLRSAIYYDAAITKGTNYYYWARARNPAGLAPFGLRNTAIAPIASGLPTITSLSSSTSVGYGSMLSLVASVQSSTTANYQWRRNGVPVANGTSSSYTRANITDAEAGDYDIVVTNAAGTVISSVIVISVRQGSQNIVLPDQPSREFSSAAFALGPTTSSAGLPVTYSIVSGPATIAGNLMTLNGAGTITFQASQAGDVHFAAAPTLTKSFNVIPQAATIELGDLLRTYDGLPQAVTATSSVAGTVNVVYSGSSVPPTTAGQYTVVASIDNGFARASRVGVLTIAPASQTIDFVAPFKIRDDLATPLTASATSGLPVSFRIDRGPGIVLNHVLTPTGVGTVAVRAEQSGDVNHDAAPGVVRSIQIVETFPTWCAARFTPLQLSDTAVSSAMADPDHDGRTNLVEYALGSDPVVPDGLGSPALSATPDADSTLWDYLYARAPDRLDVTYTVERSSNLVDWTDAGIVHEATDSPDVWHARFTTSGAATPIFFRLKIVRP